MSISIPKFPLVQVESKALIDKILIGYLEDSQISNLSTNLSEDGQTVNATFDYHPVYPLKWISTTFSFDDTKIESKTLTPEEILQQRIINKGW